MAETQPAHRVHSSQELGGSEPGAGRQILVAVDRTPTKECAAQVFVAKVLSPEQVVMHGPVGSSYKFRDATIEQAQKEIGLAREWLSREVESKVKAAGAPYVPHLFVDQTDAPADVVAHTIEKVVQEVHAKYIILAKSNKSRMEKFLVGSVANAVSKLITTGSVTLVV